MASLYAGWAVLAFDLTCGIWKRASTGSPLIFLTGAEPAFRVVPTEDVGLLFTAPAWDFSRAVVG